MNWSLMNCFPMMYQGCINGEGESRGIWRIKEWRLWMSESWFSLGFLSQNSFWKLSTFREYKGIYSSVCMECEESITTKKGVLATRTHDWNELQANCLIRLEVLSCSATAGMTLQLPCMLHTCASFGNLPVARSNREALLECTLLNFSSHSLTHYPYMIPT